MTQDQSPAKAQGVNALVEGLIAQCEPMIANRNRDPGYVGYHDQTTQWMRDAVRAMQALTAALSGAEAKPQHVAYFDDGQFHWMSGIAPRNCEFYASPVPAATAQGVTEEMVAVAQNAWQRAIAEASQQDVTKSEPVPARRARCIRAALEAALALPASDTARPLNSGEVETDLIEAAVQAALDAGLAVNGEYGVAAARHAARFMLAALSPAPSTPDGGREAETLFSLAWIGAPRPPMHPNSMNGAQSFRSIDEAVTFMLKQPSDAQFVSLTEFYRAKIDRTEAARSMLAAATTPPAGGSDA